MGGQNNTQLRVYGATLQGFAQACVNLNIVAGNKAAEALREIEVDQWYPFELLRTIERVVVDSYEKADPILERVGIQMMLGWYNLGPGKQFVKRGVDFLYFQTGSHGYSSVVKGPPELVGDFELIEIDEEKGTAVVRSSTPFNKSLERGVIIGGLSAPGDLDYIDVSNRADETWFVIEFC